MLRIIKEKQKLRKENTDMRKVIEEALQDLLDPECPPGVRILSTSIRLERALEKDPKERPLKKDPKVKSISAFIVRQIWRKSNEKI